MTPPLSSGCLPGVTREVVMELAAEGGFGNSRGSRYRSSEVGEMDEVFITSSLLGVGAVTQFDGAGIGRGAGDEKTCEAFEMTERRGNRVDFLECG